MAKPATSPAPRLAHRLTILRHAHAQWPDYQGKDFDRPLTPRGRDEATRSAARLLELALVPQLIVASAAARTRETADIVLARSPGATLQLEERLYDASAADLLSVLRQTPVATAHVLLVGHNPGVTELARKLSGESALESLATASFCSMTLEHAGWAETRPGTGRELQRESPGAPFDRWR